VEKAADKLLDKQRKRVAGAADRLYSLDGFKNEFGSVLGTDTPLSDKDAMILLKFLERDRKVLVYDKDMIKLCEGSSGPKEITSVDRGILELSNAVKRMHEQVEELHSRIDQYTQKAAAALRQKHKAVALGHLRIRKQLEDLLSKRLNSLGTLESTLINVEAAAGDIEIVKSYESSTSTLRAILAHPSLQRDSIDSTMDALAEANANARDLDDIIRIGGNSAMGVDDVVDEDELENELQHLIQQAETKNQSKPRQEETVEEADTRQKLQGIGVETPRDPPGLQEARVLAS